MTAEWELPGRLVDAHIDMDSNSGLAKDALIARVTALEGENAARAQRLEQRTRVLHVLFERMLELERAHAWLVEGLQRSRAEATTLQNAQAELSALRATKTFRWTAPARRMYARLFLRRRSYS